MVLAARVVDVVQLDELDVAIRIARRRFFAHRASIRPVCSPRQHAATALVSGSHGGEPIESVLTSLLSAVTLRRRELIRGAIHVARAFPGRET
jgi:hypothetical protein